jgi:hypothetical protein
MTHMSRTSFIAVVIGLVWLAPIAADAQSPSSGAPPAAAQAGPAAGMQQIREEFDRLKREFEMLRQQYEQRLSSLEARIGSFSGPNTAATSPNRLAEPAVVQSQTVVQTEPPQNSMPAPLPAQSLAGASKVFNPDMAVIANFVGVGGKNPFSTQPSLSLREAEMSFQAVVDPYARADFFLAAGPDGLEVEEGFLTFTSLPAGLLLKVGKLRASFGKVNAQHAHILPTTDRPLVTENLVGGEEGISDSGLSLSKLIANPLLYLEATAEVFAGQSEVFQTTQRSKLNYLGRLRAYRDLTESTNLDLGTSVAFGPTNLFGVIGEEFGPAATNLNKRLIGVDATFRYRPLRRAIYRRLQARTELVWSRQDLPVAPRQSAFGFYGLGEYQFARRWYIGARYDQSERTIDASLKDTGGSLFVTFWPSEFSQIRTQYRRTRYAEGVKVNEFLFQFRFGIGAHAAHVF